jgi:hypothetical protein
MRIKKVSDNSSLDSYFETMSNFNKKTASIGSGFEKFAAPKIDPTVLAGARHALGAADVARFSDEAKAGLKLLLGASDEADMARKFSRMSGDVETVLKKLDSGGPYALTGCTRACALDLMQAMQNHLKSPTGGKASLEETMEFMVATIGSTGDKTLARQMAGQAPSGSAPSATSLDDLIEEYHSAGKLSGNQGRHVPSGGGPSPTPRPPDTPTPRPPDTPTPRPPDAGGGGSLGSPEQIKRVADDLAKGLKSGNPEDVAKAIKAVEDMHVDDAVAVLKKMDDVDTKKVLDGLSASKRLMIMQKADVLTGGGWLKLMNPLDREFLLWKMSRGIWRNKGLALVAALGTAGFIYREEIFGSDPSAPEDDDRHSAPGAETVHPTTKEITDLAEDGNWKDMNDRLAELEESGDRKLLKSTLRRLMRFVYNKDAYLRLDRPYNFGGGKIRYVFVDAMKADNAGAVSLAMKTLRESRGSDMVIYEAANQNPGILGGQHLNLKDFARDVPDGQRVLNEAFELILDYSLGSGLIGPGSGKWRTKRIRKDKNIPGRPGAGIDPRGQERLTWKERRLQNKEIKRRRKLFPNASEMLEGLLKNSEMFEENNMNRKERFNSIKKLATEALESTNINLNDDNSRLLKEADDFSKAYYKDAVTDLSNSDQYLRSYFTGLGRLYDEKSETPKGDYKTLYNVHDETGADLVSSAHPKAIVVLDSIGRGGLVENGLEQQRQTQDVAFSTPTGNYRANYAWLRNSLKKTS